MATISSHHIKTSVTGANRRGFSGLQLLLEAGIDPRILERASQRVDDKKMARLMRLIWKKLDDEHMGFTESRSKPGTFSFAVNIMSRFETLGEALQTGFQFYNIVSDDISTQLNIEDKRATISISFRHPELDKNHFFQEFCMVIWHRVSCWLTGVRIPLHNVSFAVPDLQHKNELSYMFPCPHHFNTTSNELVFDSDYLSLPLIRSKKQVRQFLAKSPSNILSIPGSNDSLQGRIFSILSPRLGEALEFPSLDELANDLGISPSVMNRRLRKEKTTYRNIKTDMRRDLALKMLAQNKLPIYQVASILGYSESSSFVRAFNNWTGMSPKQYRKSLKKSKLVD